MAYKFKVGDKVEIVRDDTEYFPANFKKGHRGKVVDVYRLHHKYPYGVRRNGGYRNDFCARELKLIKRKGN